MTMARRAAVALLVLTALSAVTGHDLLDTVEHAKLEAEARLTALSARREHLGQQTEHLLGYINTRLSSVQDQLTTLETKFAGVRDVKMTAIAALRRAEALQKRAAAARSFSKEQSHVLQHLQDDILTLTRQATQRAALIHELTTDAELVNASLTDALSRFKQRADNTLAGLRTTTSLIERQTLDQKCVTREVVLVLAEGAASALTTVDLSDVFGGVTPTVACTLRGLEATIDEKPDEQNVMHVSETHGASVHCSISPSGVVGVTALDRGRSPLHLARLRTASITLRACSFRGFTRLDNA